MGISRAVRSGLATVQAAPAREDYTKLASGLDLKPATLTSVQSLADRGDTRRLVDVICDLRARDTHLAGVEQTRRAAVAGKPWELLPTKRRGVETPAAVIDATLDMLSRLDGFSTLIGDCQDAVLQPLAAFELGWEISEGLAWPRSATWCHPRRFWWNTAYDQPGLELGELAVNCCSESCEVVLCETCVLHFSLF